MSLDGLLRSSCTPRRASVQAQAFAHRSEHELSFAGYSYERRRVRHRVVRPARARRALSEHSPGLERLQLREICALTESSLFLAHVRATSQATIQETNCHPFRHGRWLFVHNGEIQEIEKTRRELLFRIDPRLFPEVQGTTDSEIMFFLALTFGLESEPVEAVQRMAGFVEDVSRANGVADPIWMTLGFKAELYLTAGVPF